MRYKELSDEEKKRFLDDYANLEVLKLKPEVGAIAYEAVVGGKSIIVFSKGEFIESSYQPVGVVFDIGDTIKIVHFSEGKELKWCTGNAIGYKIDMKTTLDDGECNIEIIRQSSSDFNNADLYPAFAYIRSLGEEWYMPAKDELNLIYKNKDKINNALKILSNEAGVSVKLLQGDYWSSSSYCDSIAWFQRFSDGNQYDYYKNYQCSVRAVRDIVL